MKPVISAWSGAAVLLLLAACSSNDGDGAPTVKVTELAAGAYAVSTGDASSPTAGKYYAAACCAPLLSTSRRLPSAAA